LALSLIPGKTAVCPSLSFPSLLAMIAINSQPALSRLPLRFNIKPGWLGYVLVAATPEELCAIHLGDSPDPLTTQFRQAFPNADGQTNDPTLEDWSQQVIAWMETPQARLNLPLHIQGTVFQRAVWQAIQRIPPGQTASYRAIADQIGNPNAVRAVARACASNQLAVAIPCHRVIGSDGTLRGYRWGSDRKRALLEREGAIAASAIQGEGIGATRSTGSARIGAAESHPTPNSSPKSAMPQNQRCAVGWHHFQRG